MTLSFVVRVWAGDERGRLMHHLNHLPIWRDANRLLLAIEQAVGQFSRYHKYSLGTDLRRQAMAVCRLILRAADKDDVQLSNLEETPCIAN